MFSFEERTRVTSFDIVKDFYVYYVYRLKEVSSSPKFLYLSRRFDMLRRSH